LVVELAIIDRIGIGIDTQLQMGWIIYDSNDWLFDTQEFMGNMG
jgi:hypothetical protein